MGTRNTLKQTSWINSRTQKTRREWEFTAASASDGLNQPLALSQGTDEVTAVLHVDIVNVNVVQLHAPQAGDLPGELHTVARLAGLLYNGHDLLQALRGDVHIGH